MKKSRAEKEEEEKNEGFPRPGSHFFATGNNRELKSCTICKLREKRILLMSPESGLNSMC
jgi:hypothetical protein